MDMASLFHAKRLRVARVVPLLLLLGVGAGEDWRSPALGQEPRNQRAGAQTSRDREVIRAAVAALPRRYRDWLQSVAGLITQDELEYFLDLKEDYRRDAFMESFWSVRDPDRVTPVNELRRRWQRLRDAGGLSFGDARSLLFLLNGPPGRFSLPDGRVVARCFSRSKELEIWFYDGSERTSRRFVVVFQRRGTDAPYEVVHLGEPVRPIQRSGGLPTTDVRLLCAEELLNYAFYEISRLGNYEHLMEEVLTPPLPSSEWLATFAAGTTDLPEGVETFEVTVDLRFPARKQSRTALQVMLGVAADEVLGREFDGELFHNLLLTGEVLREGRLFEGFRYRFEGPTPDGAEGVPLGFTRYLRPGPVTLRVLLKDVFSGRFAQVVQEIEVPSPQGLPVVRVSTGLVGGDVASAGRPRLRLAIPGGNLHVGQVRFRAQSTGELDKVTFYLDDKAVLTKRSPPYSVELDLGSSPTAHRVRVVGFVADQEAATDQVWLNQGAQRFRVRLIEPRAGGIYPGSLTARAEVETPDGKAPQRLELWVNEEKAATLTQAPFSHALELPSAELAVIRAVAYLEDGSTGEDTVVVNASGFQERVEVQLVELRPLVTDSSGRPIRDLTREEFRIYEDGAVQRIARFEPASQGPIHAALLLDRSSSMAPHLDQVSAAALAFATSTLRSTEDRIAVLSFAEEVSVNAGFTASQGQVERALAGLVAHGGTHLYDSLVQALSSFEGVQGQMALLLYTDGRDEGSRLSFEQALDGARRHGVALYAIGLQEAFRDQESRRGLEELASETGGQAYFLSGLHELSKVYDQVLEVLRSRYLLAYPSPSTTGEDEFRSVRVEVARRSATVQSRRGYYPSAAAGSPLAASNEK